MSESDRQHPSPATLGERLAAARRQQFVGRAEELELFRSALTAERPPFTVLFVFGPGGVGKTSLVLQLASLAGEAGAAALRIDGRSVEPGPEGIEAALGRAVAEHAARDATAGARPLDALSALGRSVLVMDTYEALGPLDDWIRDELLPRLPAGTLVIIAGRDPPSTAWRSDPGWRGLVRVVRLGNLDPADSRQLLLRHGVAEPHHEAALSLTGGHPLALSLLADLWVQAAPSGSATALPTLDAAPELVRVLLQRFVDQIPGARERRALETCAHARVTTEALLREVLGEEDAHPLFEWLRGRSFIEEGRDGLHPHDLAREALETDLRWRDPEAHRELHRRVRADHLRRLQTATGLERQRVALDLLFLHRNNPMMRAHYGDWDALGAAHAEPARSADDRAAILELVRDHEGEASASIARHWLVRQPDRFLIFRGGRREVLGFCAHLRLDLADDDDRRLDPACEAAWAFMDRHAPLRPGEQALLHRFWIDRQGYQAISPTFTLVSATSTLEWLGNPSLAWTFIFFAEPERWDGVMSHIDFQRTPPVDFAVAGRRFGAFSHDWRVRPAAAWSDLMGSRELDDGTLPPPGSPAAAAVAVLSRPDFEAAVRQLLRDHHRPDLLRSNPLIGSRLAVEAAAAAGGASPSPATLQALARQAADELRVDPRDERLFRAISATYLAPAATQELAAERLGLPFGTYRHHLAQALTRVTEWLWQRETGGGPVS